MRCLTTGLRSEKCVVRRLRHCANLYEGESNENLKYVLSRNVLTTKWYTMTSFFYVVSYGHLSVNLQTTIIILETYKTTELWFEILSRF